MSDILFDCKHCGQSLSVDGKGSGREVSCPNCKNQIKIPTVVSSSNVVPPQLPPQLPTNILKKPNTAKQIIFTTAIVVIALAFWTGSGLIPCNPQEKETHKKPISSMASSIAKRPLLIQSSEEIQLSRLSNDSFYAKAVLISHAGFAFRELQVTFYSCQTNPASDIVEQVLRKYLDEAVLLRGDREILAMPWKNTSGKENDSDDTTLKLKDGTDALYYNAVKKCVETDNEKRGIKNKINTNSQKDGVKYETKTEQDAKHTTISVVFETTIDETKIFDILVSEIRKEISSQNEKVETSAYAFIGSLSNANEMKQIRGSNGVYIQAECNPADGKIISRNLKTKQTTELGIL